MKRFVYVISLLLVLVGCSSGASLDYTMETIPKNVQGEATPIVMEVTENGEAKTGLEIVGSLEMAKMDHGTILVNFTDNGDGTYAGEVELPMGGEWIMDLEVSHDGETIEDFITFDVKEG